MIKPLVSLAAAAVVLLPATAHAASRADIATEARAIITQVAECDHPTSAVYTAYFQARKGVSAVQMTTALPYVAYPTENDLVALVNRVLPLPRTTNGRLLDDGLGWLQRATATLDAAEVC